MGKTSLKLSARDWNDKEIHVFIIIRIYHIIYLFIYYLSLFLVADQITALENEMCVSASKLGFFCFKINQMVAEKMHYVT